MQPRRSFCPLFHAADGGITGGPTPNMRVAKMTGPIGEAQVALDAEQQRLAGTGTTVTKDAYVRDRLAKELPAGASDEQRLVLQANLEAEYKSYDHDGQGLNKHEFRDLMEDRAVAGWDTHLGDAAHSTDLSDAQKTAMQTGVTTKGSEVKQKQQDLNAWLQTPGGQSWAQSAGGQSQLGADGKLKEDGLEGPRTRAVLKAMRSEQVASGAKQVVSDLELSTHHTASEKVTLMMDQLAHIPANDPARANYEAKLKGQVQYVLDKGGKHDAQELANQLDAHHLGVKDAIPDHAQRAALLNKLAKHGATPDQKATLAASLLRDDLAADKPIDGGGQAPYQWRKALDDKASATALTAHLTGSELRTLQASRPEYFQSLDRVSGGAATKAVQAKGSISYEQALAALDATGGHSQGAAAVAHNTPGTAATTPTKVEAASSGQTGKAAYETGVAQLYELTADAAKPEQLAPIAAALVRADLAAGRPIDQGADPASHEWRNLFNDKPAAEALAKQFSPAELAKLSKQQPEYFKALDLRSGGAAQARLDQAFDNAYNHRAKALVELSNGGATPDEKAALAASLVRADMRANRPIDGGETDKYQWRNLLNDAPSAKALADRFSLKELHALANDFPEYYKALDAHSNGEAQKRLDAEYASTVTYV